MRPQNYGSTFTVRLPIDTRAAIEAAAEREDTSASDWVRKALASIVAPPSARPGATALPVCREG